MRPIASVDNNLQNSFRMASWLFTRLLGVIFFIAFLSLASQIMGLAGSEGIAPATDRLNDLKAQYGALATIVKPSLLWLNSSDNTLMALATIGVVSSVALILGLLPGISLLLCWSIYLSFTNVIAYFLGFQWDQMLLECGFLSLFLVPWKKFDGLSAQESSPTQNVILFLLRWMLFRVMFCSGVAKLTGGCTVWLNFSALEYYWETQLLPSRLAWDLFWLPQWFQITGAAVTFLLEIVVPFAIFAKRPWRIIAATALVLLQTAMFFTGNHGFINLLTATLCLTLLDDQFLELLFPQWLNRRLQTSIKSAAKDSDGTSGDTKSKRLLRRAATAGFITLTTVSALATIFPGIVNYPILESPLSFLIGGYHLTGYYGLYPVVNTERREIVIEGSNDGHQWLPYTFKYQVGPVDRAPPLVLFHQPRLDWRMRFAALTPSTSNPWVSAFVQRLLQGSKPVTGLLENNPFADSPPKFVRTELFDYKFATPTEHKESGAWWRRSVISQYLPSTTLAEPGVRSMVFAGAWYPDDPATLQNLLRDLEKRALLRPQSSFGTRIKIDKAQTETKPLTALIAPHAAYRYSGVGAMRSYLAAKSSQISNVKRIILLGPLHPLYKLNLHGALLSSDNAFATPLGNIQLDTEATHHLSALPNFSVNDKAHSIEHSLEMQLPMVRYVFKGVPVVPILIAGGSTAESISSIANGLKSEIRQGDLIIVSADMTHWGKMYDYVPFTENVRENVQKLDEEAYEQIAKIDASGFAQFKKRTKENICGFQPISVLLKLLPEDAQAKVIEYYTSQDAMPKPLGPEAQRCVGYLSVSFSSSRSSPDKQ